MDLSLLPGSWELLEDPDLPHPIELVGRKSKEGYIDCIVIFYPREHLIVVTKPKVIWSGHSPLVVPGSAIGTFTFYYRMGTSPPEELVTAIARVGAMAQKDWRRCFSCRARKPYGFMQNRKVCMACAPEILGITY